MAGLGIFPSPVYDKGVKFKMIFIYIIIYIYIYYSFQDVRCFRNFSKLFSHFGIFFGTSWNREVLADIIATQLDKVRAQDPLMQKNGIFMGFSGI